MMRSRQPYELFSAPPGSAADYRERVQRAVQESEALRNSELEAQASPARDPRERIEIWERIHALSLPRAHGHVLVTVIARQTRLSVSQVREEQGRRAETEAPSTRADTVERSG